MKREYLEEDLQLIRKYFPGARTVNLRTPFDMTQRRVRPRLNPAAFRDDNPENEWIGEALWTN